VKYKEFPHPFQLFNFVKYSSNVGTFVQWLANVRLAVRNTFAYLYIFGSMQHFYYYYFFLKKAEIFNNFDNC